MVTSYAQIRLDDRATFGDVHLDPAVQVQMEAFAEPASSLVLFQSNVADAVKVETGRIVADPSKMVLGLGYPVRYQNRQWWIVNVDGVTMRLYSAGA